MTARALRLVTGLRDPRRSVVALLVVSLIVVGGHPLAARADSHDDQEAAAKHQLSNNIYEYDYLLTTSKDIHHRVGVHRVVQVEDGRPIPSENGVFLSHGDVWNFNGAFLGGTSSPRSLPVYLAGRGIDVWGVDLGWTLVPDGTTDLSFMKDWGLQRDVDDLERALSFARSTRARTGSPGNRLTLLSWSRGGWMGYALLNQESQKPPGQRNVRAFISVDNFFKVADPTVKSNVCAFEAGTNTDIANGTYGYNNDFLIPLGKLAETDPNGPSPPAVWGPPYTNLEASLTFGAAIFQFGPTYAPYYHYVAGTFPGGDITAIPNGLSYTKISRWNDFLISATPLEPARLLADTLGISCGDTHTAFDNHLKDVRVPVLYIGAAGGFGAEGLYTLTLLGSRDVESKVVSLRPPDQAALDFGHVDLFNAERAKDLVWSPIYRWLAEHASSDN